ncbi:unnamed protein product [Anisakis simplex]|uniref:Expressed conserved protein n=1 Tax=Anisakis simplex TaxID=6269 RepID=A0A0M3J407_ANISI|nr:unnamed protein product [Anisakis simplex]
MNNVCFSEHARNSSSVPIFYSSNYEDTLLMRCGLDSATVRRDAPSFFDMDSTSLPVLYSPSFSSNIEPSVDRGEQCSDTDHDRIFGSGKNFENSVDSCFSLESSQPQVAPVGVLDSSVRLPEQIVTNLSRAHHIRQVPVDSHQNSVRSNSETNKSNQSSGGMRVPLSSTKPTHSFERTSQSTSSIKRPTLRELRNCSKPAVTSKRSSQLRNLSSRNHHSSFFSVFPLIQRKYSPKLHPTSHFRMTLEQSGELNVSDQLIMKNVSEMDCVKEDADVKSDS